MQIRSAIHNILADKAFTATDGLISQSFVVTFVHPTVRRGSHRGGSPQDRLRDEQTCGMTLASTYVLCLLQAAWSQLQMKGRKSEWK